MSEGIDRRKVLWGVPAVVAGWLASRAKSVEAAQPVVVAPPEPPKEAFFRCHISDPHGQLALRTAAMKPAQAKRFMEDACRDIETIMRQGKVYPTVTTPWMLTGDK